MSWCLKIKWEGTQNLMSSISSLKVSSLHCYLKELLTKMYQSYLWTAKLLTFKNKKRKMKLITDGVVEIIEINF